MTKAYCCPNCKTPLEWDSHNPWRPFCSERCKNKDFIAWANEENRLPDDNLLDELDRLGGLDETH